jgi:DNA-binding response OmpR family regulator
MGKPLTDSSYGSNYRRNKTEQTEDDRINKPVIVDSRAQLRRILVVDDNSDIAFTLRLGLENGDATMRVYNYDNPIEALGDFIPNFYDLVLLDVNMPLMNGFELCQKLLQKDINIKVCFMTSGEVNMNAAREVHPLKTLGCFIKKPIATSALLRRINMELE